MKPLVVTPFHDLKWKQNAQANARRQGLPTLFVMNGPAREASFGMCIKSADGYAAAMNAGVVWARTYGYTHVVCMDSDDYYGPGYASHILPYLEQYDFVGRRQVFTELEDGIHLFFRHGRDFLFGTMACRTDKFLPVKPILEDSTAWVREMKESGCVGADTGTRHYCYRRHGANAHWSGIPDFLVRHTWGATRFYGKQPVEMVDHPELVNWTSMARPSDEQVIEFLRSQLPSTA